MSILELIKPSQDIQNQILLNQTTLAREYFWSSIYNDKNFENFQIKIWNVICDKCEKIISEDEDCSCVKETVVLSAGRGKKKCKNCPTYHGPRTHVCDNCGYNFKTGNIEINFKKKEKIVKATKIKKKKKAVFIELGKVKNVKLLIENDKIEENILLFKDHPLLSEDQKNTIDSYCIWRNEFLMNNKGLSDGKAHLMFHSMLKRDNLKHLKVEDLRQEGFLGLIKAFIHFDCTRTHSNTKNGELKNVAFSTYADPWIRKSIIDAIYDKDKEIFVPQYIINHFKKFKIFYNNYIERYGFEPSIKEIMHECNVNKKCAEGLLILKDIRQNKIISVEVTNDKYKNDTGEDIVIGKNDVDLINKLSEETDYDFDYLKYLDELDFVKSEYKELFLDYFGFNLNKKGQEYNIDQLEEKYGITSQTINNVIKNTVAQFRNLLEE